MKIHLLSDIHLETGPYESPADLDCDVIVAAGDIGNGTQGVKWLKTLSKPVVYVLGNHEYWSKDPVDMFDIIDQVRAEAAGSNVHFLENQSVNIEGTRFIGATLWTDLCGLSLSHVDQAQSWMNDYRHIHCNRFYEDPELLKEFYRVANGYLYNAPRFVIEEEFLESLRDDYVDKSRFHPFVSYILHEKSRQFINSHFSLDQEGIYEGGRTVIVTHHHPTYESLRQAGVAPDFFKPLHFNVSSREPTEGLLRAACYASNLQVMNWAYLFDPSDSGAPIGKKSQIDAWLCGHIHHHLDYMPSNCRFDSLSGMRVVCNPRGRYIPPLTEASAKALAFFGAPVTADMVERRHAAHKENSYEGDAFGFDSQFVVNLNDGLVPVIAAVMEKLLPDLTSLHEECLEFAPHMSSTVPAIEKSFRESIFKRAQAFYVKALFVENDITENLGHRPKALAVPIPWFSDRCIADKRNGFDPIYESAEAEIAILLDAQRAYIMQCASFADRLREELN